MRVVVVGCGRVGAGLADALVAVTGGDNSNVVAARVARDAYRVPRVIARIHDPRRAVLYEELGVVTVSSTGWALRKIRDHLEHRTLKEEHSFGRARSRCSAWSCPSTWSTGRWPT